MLRLSAAIIIVLMLIQCTKKQRDQAIYISTSDANILQTQTAVLYKEAPFSGLLFTLSGSDTVYTAVYKNGKKNGLEKTWFSSGNPKESGYYINGVKNGLHTVFYDNGKLKFTCTYKTGEFDGSFCQWYENGSPYQQKNYFEGSESGSQKTWNRDGSLYSNYVVKDGRKYGLTGTKHCLNAETDANQN